MNKNNLSWFWLALTLIFITLKLTSYIDWSWWWVLAPLWCGLAIALVVLIGVGLCFVIGYYVGSAINSLRNRKWRR